MNWDAIGSIAEVVGAIAVVVSLIYVAIQVRSTTEQNRAAMEQAIADRLNEALMVASSSDLGAIIHRGMSDFSDLDDAAKSRFTFYMAGWFRQFEQAHRQHLRGFMDAEVWNGYEEYLRMTFESDAIRKYWDARQAVYNQNFRYLVDNLMSDDSSSVPMNLVETMSRADDSKA